MSNTCLNGRTWCWFRLKMRFATLSGLDVMSLSFSLSVPFASLFMASFDAHSSFFACTKWWNCGWQTSFLESLDKFNLQKVCGEWQNWQWTQFFPKCLAFCVYSGFQEWSQNDQMMYLRRHLSDLSDLSLLNLLPTNFILRGTQRRFPPKYIENTF